MRTIGTFTSAKAMRTGRPRAVDRAVASGTERTLLPANFRGKGLSCRSRGRGEDCQNPGDEGAGALTKQFRIAVVIATCGRPDILHDIVRLLRTQTRCPDEIVVSAVSRADVRDFAPEDNVTLIFGSRGLPIQRNAGLRAVSADAKIIIFFDDDFVAHPRWIAAVAQVFEEQDSVDIITGHAVHDGTKGRAITIEEGLRAMSDWAPTSESRIEEAYSPSGCNMAFRGSAIEGLQFDERLVLYGWLEDRDFGARVMKRGGRSIKIGTAIGVHLGYKAGRVSARRLGYSQVVNPIYMYRKGTLSTFRLLEHLARNLMKNVLRMPFPEKDIDRLGRLAGNLLGILDVMRGVITPERAEIM